MGRIIFPFINDMPNPFKASAATPGLSPEPLGIVSPIELAIQIPLLLIKKFPFLSDMLPSVS